MSDIWLKNNKRIVAAYTLAVLFTSSFFILFGSSSAYGVELYTENDSPFGVHWMFGCRDGGHGGLLLLLMKLLPNRMDA
jgi:hypothetical protein